jgi:hypothetical protein
MKIICKQTTSEGFDLKEVTTIFSNDYDYNLNGFGLELGKEYPVMGIVIYTDSRCIYYLIDVQGRPDWYPYLLFEVFDNSIPKEWYFKINSKDINSDIYMICSFAELCNDPTFYDQILERDSTAMQIYFRRKIEMYDNDNL